MQEEEKNEEKELPKEENEKEEKPEEEAGEDEEMTTETHDVEGMATDKEDGVEEDEEPHEMALMIREADRLLKTLEEMDWRSTLERRANNENIKPHKFVRQIVNILTDFHPQGDASWPLRSSGFPKGFFRVAYGFPKVFLRFFEWLPKVFLVVS